MTLILLLIIAAMAIGGLSLLRPAARGRTRASSPPLVAIVATIAVLLTYLVFQYVGFGEGSRLPRTGRIRVQHLGFYFAPDQAKNGITFVGTPVSDEEDPAAFRASALQSGQSISLQPEGMAGDLRIGAYRVRSTNLTEPLRKRQESLNATYGPWGKGMADGSVLRVILPPREKNGPNRYFAIELREKRAWPRFWSVRPTLVYSQGDWEPISKKATPEGELEIFGREVEDAASFDDLISRRPTFPKDWTDQFKTPFELSQMHPAIDMGRVASGILFVREFASGPGKDARGKLGILKDPTLPEEAAVMLDRDLLDSKRSGFWTISIKDAESISVGRGRRTWRLRLQAQLAETEKGRLARVELIKPPSWPLPPKPEKPILLSASTQQLPIDGYVFDSVPPEHAFHAKAWFRDNFGSLDIADGREGKPYAADEPIYLGDSSKGVIADWTVAQADPPYAGTLAIVFLLLHAALVAAALKARRAIGPGETAFVLIWIAALTILCIRLIIAFRVAVLPPPNAGLNELAIFRSTLPLALWALGLIPLAMELPFLMSGERKERPGRRTSALEPIGIGLSEALSKLPSPFRGGGAGGEGPGFLEKTLSSWQNRFLLVAVALLMFLFARGDEAILGLRASIITFCALIVLLAVDARRRATLTDEQLRAQENPVASRIAYAVAFALGILATICSWAGFPLSTLLIGAAIAAAATGLVFSRTPLWGIALFGIIGLLGIVKDMGSALYILPLAFGIGTAYYRMSDQVTKRARRTSPWQRRVWIAAFAATLLLILNFGALVPHMLQRVPLGSTIYYRLATQHGQDDTVLRDSRELEARLFKQNSQQRWQMLLYAARGVHAPNHGYGDLRLTNVGMTYSTMLTDTLYAVFLMGEHGLWSAVLFVLLYAGICAVCIAAAWKMPEKARHYAAPLVAIGGFYGLQAGYMAATNVGQLVFTGQNVPLLGLYSKGDVLQSLFLVGFAATCIVRGLKPAEPRSAPAAPMLIWLLPLISLGLVTATYLGGRSLAVPKPGTEDYDLDPKLITEAAKRIKDNTVELDKSGHLKANRPEKLSALERAYIEEFNFRTDKKDARRGLYYVRDDGGLGFNEYGFRLASPYKSAELPSWKGKLLARKDKSEQARLVYLGKKVTLRVSATGTPTRISLGRRNGSGRAPGLTLTRPGSDVGFGEVYARDGKIYIFAKQPGAVGKWSFYRDGEKLSYGKEYELSPYQIVVIRDPRGMREHIYNLLYLGSEDDPLAFVRWSNGSYRRIFNDADAFTLAYSIGEAGDALALEQKDIRLSIDRDLQKELHQAILKWARNNPRFGYNRVEAPNISLTVMDPFTGEVVAMPTFPSIDPTSEDLEALREKVQPWRYERLIGNHNFVPHVVGSAVKPIVFSALAAELKGQMNLQDLIVRGTGKPDADGYTHEKLAGVDMLPPRTFPAERSSMPMDDFLTYSYDWPELVLGALGLATNPEAARTKLLTTPGSQTDVSYKGREYGLNLYRLSEVPLTGPENHPLMRTETMRRTLLFRGLEDAFAVDIGVRREYEAEEVAARMKLWFPDLEPRDRNGKLKPWAVGYSRLVMPYVSAIDASSMQGFGTDYISFLLGGGDGWNNILMAQSMARMVSGKRVTATLQKPPLQKPDNMPAPLRDAAWRRKNLLSPLQRVPVEGTAKSMRSFVNSLGDIKLALKTGTLAIKTKGPDSETMMFVIGKQDPKGNYLPGKTFVGAFYLHESNAGSMQKFSFAEAILRPLAKQLSR
ncbi:MAG: hypothetical protein ACAH95_03290 [Fimbriimonas sp.]